VPTEPLAELTWVTIDVDLPRPVRVGRLVIATRQYCCVRVRLADGSEGEAFVLTRGLDVAACLDRVVRPRLAGATIEFDNLRVAVRNLGWDGPISRAAAAVSLAVLDATARAAGKPVWRLLAPATQGWAPRVLPAVVAIGYVPVDADESQTEVAEAVRAAEEGAAWVKLMGGHPDPEVDLVRVRRARAAVGPRCDVALDVNGAWPLGLTRNYLPRLLDEGVSFVEEPVAYELGLDVVRGLADVRRPMLAFGEVSASVIELEALAATGLVDYLRPDATVLGGQEAFVRSLRATSAHGCGLMPHFWPEVHRQLAAAYPGESVVECVAPGAGGFGLERFVGGVARLGDGGVALPEDPGFGFLLDWAAIERMAVTAPTTVGMAT
jgi:L-alanine-DL-glutamate epimerase-like enolase superfamily enzyme